MSRAEGPALPIVTHQPSGKIVRASRPTSTTNEQPQVPLLVINRYRVTTLIGSGSFGHIFEADDIHTHEQVAVKFESHSLQYPQLEYEARVLKLISGTGIPKIFWYGEVDDYNVLVMEKLGPSIEDLLCYCRRSFSLKTVLLLAEQMLKRLQHIHSRTFLHRDLKPDNFLMGVFAWSHRLYLIDFGLSKRYIDSKTRRHILYREGKGLTGTPRYASINSHLGKEQSRRDDLEALGYVLVYLYEGRLPWQGLKAAAKSAKYEKICERKLHTSVESLCINMPIEFSTYLKYCRNLEFTDEANYQYLLELFDDLFVRHGFVRDYIYDWNQIHFRRESTSMSTSNRAPSILKNGGTQSNIKI
ncbi:unnamed protein product [Rotaria magnacalcarata]|uniref:non-specific serine/threonine protein kinase n=1 Tax=Rotaria magnacalcarata TaxID=392030 RepID=A0A816K6L1_9BILA|nr:unnamed protein product [Rotaria magnacalcarata]CAF4822604.1 unnamed protein product [Rotaria magnacalcarata]